MITEQLEGLYRMSIDQMSDTLFGQLPTPIIKIIRQKDRELVNVIRNSVFIISEAFEI